SPPQAVRGSVAGSVIEPSVLKPPIVDDAVDHHRPVPDPRLPAIGEAVVENDRPGAVLRQLSFDLPYELLAFCVVRFRRLAIKHLSSLRIAIAGVIARGTAGIVFVELLVGVTDATAGEIEADLVVLAHNLGKPAGGLDDFELAVDEYLLQLVGQDD